MYNSMAPWAVGRRFIQCLKKCFSFVGASTEQAPTALRNRDGSVRATSTGGRRIYNTPSLKHPSSSLVCKAPCSVLSPSPTRVYSESARNTLSSSHSGFSSPSTPTPSSPAEGGGGGRKKFAGAGGRTAILSGQNGFPPVLASISSSIGAKLRSFDHRTVHTVIAPSGG